MRAAPQKERKNVGKTNIPAPSESTPLVPKNDSKVQDQKKTVPSPGKNNSQKNNNRQHQSQKTPSKNKNQSYTQGNNAKEPRKLLESPSHLLPENDTLLDQPRHLVNNGQKTLDTASHLL